MAGPRPLAHLASTAAVIALGACGPASARDSGRDDAGTRAQVEAAMQRYQAVSRLVNADSTAALYTTTAVLFEPGINPVVTRDSIRAFIASFPGVTVEVATATPDSIEVHGDMALYWGTYHEKLSFPGQPASDQRGKFVAQWVRQPGGAWLVERMYRIPLPERAPPAHAPAPPRPAAPAP